MGKMLFENSRAYSRTAAVYARNGLLPCRTVADGTLDVDRACSRRLPARPPLFDLDDRDGHRSQTEDRPGRFFRPALAGRIFHPYRTKRLIGIENIITHRRNHSNTRGIGRAHAPTTRTCAPRPESRRTSQQTRTSQRASTPRAMRPAPTPPPALHPQSTPKQVTNMPHHHPCLSTRALRRRCALPYALSSLHFTRI